MAPIYVLISAASSILIGVLFKLFGKYQIQKFQAITFNYFICVLLGFILIKEPLITSSFWKNPEFPFGALLGFIYLIAFIFVALAVEYFGIALSVIFRKTSLILPVCFGILYYGESTQLLKILSIVLAFVALILSNSKSKSPDNKTNKKRAWYVLFIPIIVFLNSGLVSVIFQYVKTSIIPNKSELPFIIFTFATAAFFGILSFTYALLRKKITVSPRSILAGFVLGIPNFTSSYFLLLALGTTWESSIIFTMTSLFTIGGSTIIGAFIFKEKLSKLNWIGILFTILSIILISFVV